MRDGEGSETLGVMVLLMDYYTKGELAGLTEFFIFA